MKRLLKNGFACLLAVLLLCQAANLTGGTVHAAAWTGAVATGFSAGDGSAENPYLITNEDEFAYFLQNINAGVLYSNLHFSLTADLDMTGGTLAEPIYNTGFCGVFNGNTHTIKSNVPFLGTIGTNAVVKLLQYQCLQSSSEVLCYTNAGTIDSCVVYGTVHKSSDRDGGASAALLCFENSGRIIATAARGSVSTRAGGASSAGFVYKNTGTIENSYSAVAVSASGIGKYASSSRDAFIDTNSGTVTDCYYDSSLGSAVSALAAPTPSETLKSSSMISILNAANPSLCGEWCADTANTNEGYPILFQNLKIEENVSIPNTEALFTYHTESQPIEMVVSSDRSCNIYYTLDGTDPRSSATRVLYNPTSPPKISGDVTITMVACFSGVYGKITTQKAIYIAGSGTALNPYRLADKNDLTAIAVEPAAHYVLINDIVFEDSDYTTAGLLPNGWTSIPEFSGSLNGDGHKIENLQGLNSFIDYNSGRLSYTRFINLQIMTSGALVNANGGRIDHCYIDLNIEHTVGRQYTGGAVAGITGNGIIEYCTVTGDLTVKGPEYKYCFVYVGGIVSSAGGQGVKSCYSNLNITVNSLYVTEYVYAGGIAHAGTVSDCASETVFHFNVSLDYDIYCSAGLGNYYGTQITRCYGSVSYSGGRRTTAKELAYNSKSYTNGQQHLETNFADLDFINTWMITPEGPRPQGIMNQDGFCLYKRSYTAPTCHTAGQTLCQNQNNTETTLTLPTLPHSLKDGVCINTGCGYKPVTSLSLSYNGKPLSTVLEADANLSYQLTATLLPTDATDSSISWSSSNSDIATVSQDGLVSALADGSCTITATAADNKKATAQVHVTKTIYLNKIKIEDAEAVVGASSVTQNVFFATDKDVNSIYCVLRYPNELSLEKLTPVDFSYVNIEDQYSQGSYTTLIINCLYSETENIGKHHTFIPFSLTFNVSEKAAPGNVAIEVADTTCILGNTAYAFEEALSGTLTLAPRLVDSVTIAGESAISSPTQYTAMVSPDYASDKTVNWSIDKTDVATVDSCGIVTPLTSGTVVLTATAADGSGASDSLTIEVTMLPEQLEIIGEEEITTPSQYSAISLPDRTTEANTSWSVSDENVAVVDENGLVTPLKNGKIVLTATTKDENGLSATKSIIITVSVRADVISSDIGLWDKPFDSNQTEYILYLPQDSESFYLTTSFQNATAKMNGFILLNGIQKKVTLSQDTTTLEIVLTPTAGNTLQQNTYTITVFRCGGTKTTISPDRQTLTIQPVQVEKGKTVMLALYNGEKLVETHAAINNGGALIFNATQPYTRAKVMAFAMGSLTPACTAEQVQ